jgi:SAM-dependent methyltransferase
MTNFEDHFSAQARIYAHHRPSYPCALFDYLASISPSHQLAWDCGTGNGQAAQELAKHFTRVIATDGSAEQIAQAAAHKQIEYRVERAEEVRLEPRSVDLVTVATAVHWFDLEPFYEVVHQALRPGGIIAVWMYHLPVITPSIDPILMHYYKDVLAGYWPEKIRYLEDRYRTLPFPFNEIEPPTFEIQADWRLEQLAGFLDSWSATRSYQKEWGENPINLIWQSLMEAWGRPDLPRAIRWPLYLRVGRVG